MSKNDVGRTILLLILLPVTVIAQVERDVAPLTSWLAPLYWQPSQAESKAGSMRHTMADDVGRESAASDITPAAQTPANSLVFVGMTPCRVVDTRTGSGFTGAFGAPSLVGGAVRTFPIQSSTTCSIPSIAQAYSFNVTVVPFGFLDYITIWPTGQAQPYVSTLNSYVATVIANAAIVPAGTSGSVDVFASQNTNLVIDIDGYYAPQSGITLAQGTASGPSLSFSADTGTGIFSAGAGTLNIATGGTNRLSVASTGLTVTGNQTITGSLALNGTLYGTNLFASNISVGGSATLGNGVINARNLADDGVGVYAEANGPNFGGTGVVGKSFNGTAVAGVSQNGTAIVGLSSSANTAYAGYFDGRVAVSGNVGIGTIPPTNRLDVRRIDNNGGDVISFGSPTYNMGRLGEDTAPNKVYLANTYPSDSSFLDFRVKGNASTDSKMVIQGNGNVGIGTALPDRKLTVNGDADKPGGGSWSVYSDERLKNISGDFTPGLKAAMQLQPLRYEYKADNALNLESVGEHIGFSAQAVQKVVPEAVTKNDKGYLLINNDPILWTMLNAIKEQQAQIEDQQKRISEQQEQFQQQQRQIQELKQMVCLDHPNASICK